jgi:ferredoxin-NADP reductase
MTCQPSPITAGDHQLALRVSSLHHQAEGVLSLGLRTADGSPLPQWTPGAHLEIDLGERMVRHYSLCGDPDDEEWRIAVLREPASRGGSKLIHDTFRPGHAVRVKGPRNNFALSDSRRYLFIAGGIGITPILPMVRDVARRGRPWTLVYGGRTLTSMAFVDDLNEVPGGDLHIFPEDEYGLLDLDHFLRAPCATQPFIVVDPVRSSTRSRSGAAVGPEARSIGSASHRR